jgi:hypothetical protein
MDPVPDFHPLSDTYRCAVALASPKLVLVDYNASKSCECNSHGLYLGRLSRAPTAYGHRFVVAGRP